MRVIPVTAVGVAGEAGSEKAANTSMLGVVPGLNNTGVDRGFYTDAREENFTDKPKLLELNRKAFELAENWVKNLK